MIDRSSEEGSLAGKSRRREMTIVIAAFLIACIVGLALRAHVIGPISSGQPEAEAK